MKDDRLLRAQELDIGLLKLLVPKILVRCGNFLSRDLSSITNLTFDQIKQFFPEPYGDLDNCGGLYRLETLTNPHFIQRGRVIISYYAIRERREFDIHVTSQEKGKGEKVDEITQVIKELLDEEKINYSEIDL